VSVCALFHIDIYLYDVCVCVCVCMYVCVCVCKYVLCTCVGYYVNICMFLCICSYVCVFIHVYVYRPRCSFVSSFHSLYQNHNHQNFLLPSPFAHKLMRTLH